MPPSSDGLKGAFVRSTHRNVGLTIEGLYGPIGGRGTFLDDIFLRRLILVRVSTQTYIQL